MNKLLSYLLYNRLQSSLLSYKPFKVKKGVFSKSYCCYGNLL